MRLLHRTTRKLSLTDGGQDFFQRMQAVIAETEAATLAVTGAAHEPRGVVRLTAPPGAAGLAQVFTKIARRYPELVLEVRLTTRIVDLVEEGIDLAIRGGVLEDSSLVARKLADPISRCSRRPRTWRGAAAAHAARSRSPRLPALRRQGRQDPVAAQGAARLRERRRVGTYRMRRHDLAARYRHRGYRDGAAAADVAAHAVKAGRLARVLPSHGIVGGGLYLVWPSQRLVPARVVAVRELLIEELTKLRA